MNPKEQNITLEQFYETHKHYLSTLIHSGVADVVSIAYDINNLPDQDRKTIKGDIIYSILTPPETDLETKSYNELKTNVFDIVSNEVVNNEVTSALDKYNNDKSDTNEKNVIRQYLSTTFLTSSENKNANINDAIKSSLGNPENIYKLLNLFEAPYEAPKDSILDKLNFLTKSNNDNKQFEAKAWVVAYLSSLTPLETEELDSLNPKDLEKRICKDINKMALPKASEKPKIDKRHPFPQNKLCNIETKGGTTDIAIENNGYWCADVTISEDMTWEGNQFIRHASGILSDVISPSNNPLMVDKDTAKTPITKEDMNQFISLLKDNDIHYAITTVFSNTDSDRHQKAACQYLTTQYCNSKLYNVGIDPGVIDIFFQYADYSTRHKDENVDAIKGDELKQEVTKFVSALIKADTDDLKWKSDSYATRDSKSLASIFVLRNIDNAMMNNQFQELINEYELEIDVNYLTKAYQNNSNYFLDIANKVLADMDYTPAQLGLLQNHLTTTAESLDRGVSKDVELSSKDAELNKREVDNLVEWAVGPENFGTQVPIGKKTQALLDLAQTNVYAATCVVRLFEGAGLDKDADKYRDLATDSSDSAPKKPHP
jgi:hypothetical protein